MGELYLPLCVLTLGVLLRSVSFEIRLRAPQEWQSRWLFGFAFGSLLTAVAHGFLLAQVVVSYQAQAGYLWFSLFIRSEENQSELQALMRISYAGFCLKKK